VALSLLMAAAPGAVPGQPESAPDRSEVRLRHEGIWMPVGGLSPGSVLRWQVAASLAPDDVSTFTVHLKGRGDLAGRAPGLRGSVWSCSRPWEVATGTCRGRRSVLLSEQPLRGSRTSGPGDPARARQDGRTWLLVALTLSPDAPQQAQGTTAEVALGVTATGGRTGAPARLPTTGAELALAGLLGLGLVGTGVLALLGGSPRRDATP
jgi:hypothetical protein